MEPFKILPSYKLLIYTVYKYYVLINEIPTHLKNQHQQLTPAERQAIFKATYNPNLYNNQQSLSTLKIPTKPILPITELKGPFTGAFRYDIYRFITYTIHY